MWLSVWSEDEEAATNTGKRNLYLGIYGMLGFFQVHTSKFSRKFYPENLILGRGHSTGCDSYYNRHLESLSQIT